MTGADESLAWFLTAVLLSAAISVTVLWIITRYMGHSWNVDADQKDARISFVIKDEMVVDQSQGADGQDVPKTWSDLRAWFASRFPTLPIKLADIGSQSTEVFCASSSDDEATITIQHRGRTQHVTLTDETSSCPLTRHFLISENRHSIALKNVLENAPTVIFGMSSSGELMWFNARFEQLPEAARIAFMNSVRERGKDAQLQISLEEDGRPNKRHYELSVLPGDGHVVVYASEVTRLVEADSVRKSFVQTLTKTFADLSTGLAVFDRDQRLVLFNPAILDLTNLPADFLTMRPHMIEFFDRLRDKRVMPEPKDYSTWRGQITEMIKSASSGFYSESWSLPGGLTYKLTGRPHPNGAIAFIIEDITDEMALTRQSRSQLETHQAILDAMQEAIAVIGPDGGLLISNASFSDLVGFDPDTSLSQTTLADVVSACRQRFPDAAVWDDLGDQMPVRPIDSCLRDGAGTQVRIRIESLPDGLFMLNLTVVSTAVPLSA